MEWSEASSLSCFRTIEVVDPISEVVDPIRKGSDQMYVIVDGVF